METSALSAQKLLTVSVEIAFRAHIQWVVAINYREKVVAVTQIIQTPGKSRKE